MTASKGMLELPVIRDRVLGVEVVRGYARLCDLALMSRADIYDGKTNPTGTQRDLSPKHARDAYEYVRREELAFWPEVFLCLRNGSVFRYIPGKKVPFGQAAINLSRIGGSSEVMISRVDGNHRLHFADGCTEGYAPIEKVVSFCLAINLSLNDEIKLFRDINNNQRRMNTSHLDNIKLRLVGETELKRTDPALYIAQHLARDTDSPLVGLVYEGGKREVAKFIPLRTLKTGIEYMFSRPSRLTALEDIDVQLKLIKYYFVALRKWEPSAWKHPQEYLMLRGAGFWGICFLGAEVLDRALANGKYKPEYILQILRSGAEWDWSRDGHFKGFSGRSGAVRIRDLVAAELEDSSGVSLKSLVKQISEEI